MFFIVRVVQCGLWAEWSGVDESALDTCTCACLCVRARDVCVRACVRVSTNELSLFKCIVRQIRLRLKFCR
jgi:hypothetical protein